MPIEIQLFTIAMLLLAILNVASAIAVILLAVQTMHLKLRIKNLKPEANDSTSEDKN